MKKMRDFDMYTLVSLVESEATELLLYGVVDGMISAITHGFYQVINASPEVVDLTWKNSESELSAYWHDRTARPGDYGDTEASRLNMRDCMTEALLEAVHDWVDYGAILKVLDGDDVQDLIFVITPDAIQLETT